MAAIGQPEFDFFEAASKVVSEIGEDPNDPQTQEQIKQVYEKAKQEMPSKSDAEIFETVKQQFKAIAPQVTGVIGNMGAKVNDQQLQKLISAFDKYSPQARDKAEQEFEDRKRMESFRSSMERAGANLFGGYHSDVMTGLSDRSKARIESARDETLGKFDRAQASAKEDLERHMATKKFGIEVDKERSEAEKREMEKQQQQLLNDPTSPVSVAAQKAFKKYVPDITDETLSKMSAAQIIGIAPTLEGAIMADLNARIKEIELKKKANEPLLTPAQKTVDTEFAKEYNDFVSAGGYADIDRMLSQLDTVVNRLKTSENISGPVISLVPEWLRKRVPGLQESVDTKQMVQEVVQRSLRQILGAQFTEIEGRMLMDRAYDDAYDEKINMTRVQRLIKQLRVMAKAKEDAIKYYEKNGTLKGFKGKLPTFDDVQKVVDNLPKGETKETPQSPQSTGSTNYSNLWGDS